MHSKGTFCPAVGRPGEHPPGRKVLRSGCAVLHPAPKVERVWKSNQSRNAPKVEGLSLAWKSNDLARKNLRQSRIGLVLCAFVSWFRYKPRIFDHFAWRFVSIDNFGCGIIIRVQGSFLMMTASRSRYSLLYFPLLGFHFLFWALFPSAFPLFWGLMLPLTGISALVLGFTMAFKRIARFFAWL